MLPLALALLVPAAPPRLNVVLIVADDLGARDLGCDGSKYHRTPRLDKLAAEGVRFTSAYAACPVCSPSRVAILTGKHPTRSGITDWLPGRPDRPDQKLARPKLPAGLAPEEVTLAERFRDAGYATGMVGKWHLGAGDMAPEKQGFAVNVAGDDTGTPRSYFAPFRNAGGDMPGLEKAPAGEYLTDRLAAEAAGFIEANRDKPFFLYLPHYAPHTPLKAPADAVAHFKPGPAGQQGNPVYAAMLERLDAAVGAVLDALEATGNAGRTVVVFTSDNGGLVTSEAGPVPATINSPLREGKGFLYEGGVRVPLIVRAPGFQPAVSGASVIGTDLTPTLLELAGLPPAQGLDGASFAPTLRGETPPARSLCWHYPHYSNQGGRPGGAIRSGPLKLIESYETGRAELFDLSRDPSESRNLAPDRPDDVKRLRADLAAWRANAGAKAPTPNPAYNPHPAARDGTVTLPAKGAEVRGRQLRYELLPHKNTLGFWTDPADTAHWEFSPAKPGRYAVEVLQGCGKGAGGSEVELRVGASTLRFTVEDTGGWQNFVRRTVGTLEVGTGRQTLDVVPVRKAGAAVMDVREVVLRPQ